MEFVFYVLLALWVFPWVLMLIDKCFDTAHSCKIMGWHDGLGSGTSFDGCSLHAKCSKCGKEVMQDSQGNWF